MVQSKFSVPALARLRWPHQLSALPLALAAAGYRTQQLSFAFAPVHRSGTTVVVIAVSFLLAWATYRFIETPIRTWRPTEARWRSPVALAVAVAAVAILGNLVTYAGGLPGRYPAEVAALLSPLKVGSDDPPDAESRNRPGPTVIVLGDSHAGHLMPGLRRLQSTRPFTVHLMGWGACPPWGDVAWGNLALRGNEDCNERTAGNEKSLQEIRPDIVVLAGFWREYEHAERVGETIEFLNGIGVRRVVIIGTVPFWRGPPQLQLFKAYKSDPAHLVPNRLQSFDKRTLDFDRRLKEVAAKLGAVFISSYDTLCNEAGCLARLGNTSRDIIQVDLTHFSAAGSWFLVSHIEDRLFGELRSESPSVPTTAALKR